MSGGWKDRALCAEVDPEIFYPERGGSDAGHVARKVCGTCPVQAECLTEALETAEQWGIWGGKTERERAKIRRQEGAT